MFVIDNLLVDINYSLIANYIAFVILVLKSVFDLWVNRYLYNQEISGKVDSLIALNNRNRRGATTSAFAFAAMSLSVIFSIGGSMKDEASNINAEEIASFQQVLVKHSDRLKLIENTIWPPTREGDYGSPVPDGPKGPSGVQQSLDEIKKQIADLSAKGEVTEGRLETLISIVNQLTENVEVYEKSVNQLQKFMAAPAG